MNNSEGNISNVADLWGGGQLSGRLLFLPTPLCEAGSSALPPISYAQKRSISPKWSGVQSLEPDCQDSIPNLHLISTHQLCAAKQSI